MSNPYIGEIRMFAGNFAPVGWAFCHGQALSIYEYDALASLLGTTYGGSGDTFNLPDLRGRVPIHKGTNLGANFPLGQAGGVEGVTLTTDQMPMHTHDLFGSANNASTANASGNILAQTPSYTPYIQGFPGNTPMYNQAVSPDGGSQSHTNIQPYQCVNFIIAVEGIFPSR